MKEVIYKVTSWPHRPCCPGFSIFTDLECALLDYEEECCKKEVISLCKLSIVDKDNDDITVLKEFKREPKEEKPTYAVRWYKLSESGRCNVFVEKFDNRKRADSFFGATKDAVKASEGIVRGELLCTEDNFTYCIGSLDNEQNEPKDTTKIKIDSLKAEFKDRLNNIDISELSGGASVFEYVKTLEGFLFEKIAELQEEK